MRGRAAASASISAGSTRSNVARVSGSTLVGIVQIAVVEIEDVAGVRAVERAEVTHHLSTQFARFGRPGMVRGRRHPEPASPCRLGYYGTRCP